MKALRLWKRDNINSELWPPGKQTAESETFTIIKKKASKPVIATPSPGPIEKKTEASSLQRKKPQFSQKSQKDSEIKETKPTDKDIEQPESLEIKLGTYWFVRIGVLLLLTGLGSLAWFNKDFSWNYQTKVTLFYILSFGMGGLGLRGYIEEKKNSRTSVRF